MRETLGLHGGVPQKTNLVQLTAIKLADSSGAMKWVAEIERLCVIFQMMQIPLVTM
jgi:hypothetical protein